MNSKKNTKTTTFPNFSCGISRIWISPFHRRLHVGKNLITAVQSSSFQGKTLSMDEIAFSAPTEDGKKFARGVTHRDDFFVYQQFTSFIICYFFVLFIISGKFFYYQTINHVNLHSEYLYQLLILYHHFSEEGGRRFKERLAVVRGQGQLTKC